MALPLTVTISFVVDSQTLIYKNNFKTYDLQIASFGSFNLKNTFKLVCS